MTPRQHREDIVSSLRWASHHRRPWLLQAFGQIIETGHAWILGSTVARRAAEYVAREDPWGLRVWCIPNANGVSGLYSRTDAIMTLSEAHDPTRRLPVRLLVDIADPETGHVVHRGRVILVEGRGFYAGHNYVGLDLRHGEDVTWTRAEVIQVGRQPSPSPS